MLGQDFIEELVTYKIFNSLGILVKEGIIDRKESERIAIDANSWNPGTYTIFVGGSFPTTKKITIMK